MIYLGNVLRTEDVGCWCTLPMFWPITSSTELLSVEASQISEIAFPAQSHLTELSSSL